MGEREAQEKREITGKKVTQMFPVHRTEPSQTQEQLENQGEGERRVASAPRGKQGHLGEEGKNSLDQL